MRVLAGAGRDHQADARGGPSASAAGRLLLANLPDPEIEALYAGCRLVAPTGRRLAGLDELLQIIDQARRCGYAESIDETELGLHCLAAPVGPPGTVAAAITLCIPTGRMTGSRKPDLLADLRAAARELAPSMDP
jgi:DNA-binding IclR family transcriptional regulator